MNDALLRRIFLAIGVTPSLTMLEAAAGVVNADEDAREAVWRAASDREAFGELAALADRSGSCGITALDLTVVVTSGPGALVRGLPSPGEGY